MTCENCTGACEGKDSGYGINIVINIRELHITHEDQCTYVEHVYMEDEVDDIRLDLDLE